MKQDTIIKLMKQECAKLLGKVSAYHNYKDKRDFWVDARVCLATISELIEELKKELDKNEQ